MTTQDPTKRPTADEALKRLKSIASSQSYFTLRHRLVASDASRNYGSAVFENLGILVHAALIPVKFVFGIPSQTVNAVRGVIRPKDKKKIS